MRFEILVAMSLTSSLYHVSTCRVVGFYQRLGQHAAFVFIMFYHHIVVAYISINHEIELGLQTTGGYSLNVL